MGRMNTKKHTFDPDYAIVPGKTLRDVIRSLDMNQKELAQRTELTENTILRIIKGTQPISYETANKLELVTGVSAQFWNNLEAQYREQLVKIEERKRLQKDIEWLDTIPVKDLIERRIIEPSRDRTQLLRDVLKFFGISSVAAWYQIWENPQVAARRSTCFESSPGPVSVWIRLGILQAQKLDCSKFDKKTFRTNLAKIRKLTIKAPEEFVPEMQGLCAEAGVAVVLVKEFRKVPWNGATKWLSPHKAMILLNIRGKTEDKFWFSFFHEAAHVLNDSKSDLYISKDKAEDDREINADSFASEMLIPHRFDPLIKEIKTKARIRFIANELEISPGIVAGRYQFLTQKWQYFKDQQRNFEWTADSTTN